MPRHGIVVAKFLGEFSLFIFLSERALSQKRRQDVAMKQKQNLPFMEEKWPL